MKAKTFWYRPVKYCWKKISVCFSTTACSFSSSNGIRFFIRSMSGKSIVLHANADDTIGSIHDKIYFATGVPLLRQRLIYGSKQLESHHTLFHYNITNDSTIYLVARVQSTSIHDLLDAIHEARFSESVLNTNKIKDLVTNSMFCWFCPDVFVSSGLHEALVKLYSSTYSGNKECAQYIIRGFINECTARTVPFKKPCEFVHIVLHFCEQLHVAVPHDDPLYRSCLTCLGLMLNTPSIIGFQDNIPSVKCPSAMKIFSTEVHEFNMLFHCVVNATIDPKDLNPRGFVCSVYLYLFRKMQACLDQMENDINTKVKPHGGWNGYLPILKILHSTSILYVGREEGFWTDLRPYKVALCNLIIVEYAKRSDIDDYKWIINRRDVTDFESRRHLVMMLLQDLSQGHGNRHTMFINRSNLLAESFESITRANEATLRGPISVEFENEKATGIGVLREWFMLVCQAIFNPQNALFLACPTDRRRFFPNPASKINPGHLEYFRFAGMVIALALIHKMQVGITFTRAFCLQLAGINVSWKDIKDDDPYLYNSCKQILEMDPCVVDQDILGLTFMWEFEELGVKKVVELCADGEHIGVDSKNRKEYIDLIIKHKFVTSIADQLSHFSKGFAETVGNKENTRLCYEILELKDLDWMLRGSERDISLDDWKAHTQYKGYKEDDPQIYWFWKIVREMSVEQRQVLLFFWTSVKYLPIEGFRGLASRLCIVKSDMTYDRLPSSHTCFNEFCMPAYPSMDVMQERLNIITQEYVGCSFGTA